MAACRRCGETAPTRPIVGVSPPARRERSRLVGIIRRRCVCALFNFVSVHYKMLFHGSRSPVERGSYRLCALHSRSFCMSLFLTLFLLNRSRDGAVRRRFSWCLINVLLRLPTPPPPPPLISRPKVCRICGCVSGESMDTGRR